MENTKELRKWLDDMALSHPLVGACLVAVFFIIFAFANFETTFAQFAKLRFSFTTSTIAWLFAYAGLLGAARGECRVVHRRLVAHRRQGLDHTGGTHPHYRAPERHHRPVERREGSAQ